MRTAASGQKSSRTVAALLDLGRTQLALGRAQEARTMAEVALLRVDVSEPNAKLEACCRLLLARSFTALGLLDKARPQLKAATDECNDSNTRWIAQMELLCVEIQLGDILSWDQIDNRIATLRSQQPNGEDSENKRIHRTNVRLIDALTMAQQTARARALLHQMIEDAAGPVPRLGAGIRLAMLQPAGLRGVALSRILDRCVADLGNDHLLTLVARLQRQPTTDEARKELIEQAVTYLGPAHPLVCSAIKSPRGCPVGQRGERESRCVPLPASVVVSGRN